MIDLFPLFLILWDSDTVTMLSEMLMFGQEFGRMARK
jgi:hypothetical protein